MEQVLTLLAAVGSCFLGWGAANLLRRKSMLPQQAESISALLWPRLSRDVGRLSIRLLPPRVMKPWQDRLCARGSLAGLDERVWPGEALVGAHLIAMLVGILVWLLLFKRWPPLLCLVVGAGVGFWYAGRRLRQIVAARQHLIAKSFPFALDLMQLCVSSGQSIGSSVKQLVDNLLPGPVREEFTRVLAAQQNSVSLSDAFRRMGARIQAPEIRSVLLALQQALERGGQISETLKSQTEQLRFNRLMAVEEEIQKLPTRMTLPVVLFFMPCTLIMSIGPLAISLIRR